MTRRERMSTWWPSASHDSSSFDLSTEELTVAVFTQSMDIYFVSPVSSHTHWEEYDSDSWVGSLLSRVVTRPSCPVCWTQKVHVEHGEELNLSKGCTDLHLYTIYTVYCTLNKNKISGTLFDWSIERRSITRPKEKLVSSNTFTQFYLFSLKSSFFLTHHDLKLNRRTYFHCFTIFFYWVQSHCELQRNLWACRIDSFSLHVIETLMLTWMIRSQH